MKKNLFSKNTFQSGPDLLTPEQNCSMINKLGNQNKTLRFVTHFSSSVTETIRSKASLIPVSEGGTGIIYIVLP